MEPLRKELAEGVFLTYVPAAKFKTGVLGAQLITPLEDACNRKWSSSIRILPVRFCLTIGIIIRI